MKGVSSTCFKYKFTILRQTSASFKKHVASGFKTGTGLPEYGTLLLKHVEDKPLIFIYN